MEWGQYKERNQQIKNMLNEGESITHIAKVLQCNKSTVAYYSQKYGFHHSAAVGKRIEDAKLTREKAIKQSKKAHKKKTIKRLNNSKERVAIAKKIDRRQDRKDVIRQAVKIGLTSQEIVDMFGYPMSAVRYYREDRAKFKRTTIHRIKIKLKAIDYSGGECIICGYKKCRANLTFHHLDRKEKEIGIGSGRSYGWEVTKREVDKTILICHNCHGEIHCDLIRIDDTTIAKQRQIRKTYIDKPLTEYNGKPIKGYINTKYLES